MPKRMKLRPQDLKFGKNMRTKELDESLLLELAESMRVKQLQPIIVAPDYTVIVGNRRGKAALLGKLEFIEAEVLDEMPTESTILMYQWAENFFREEATDWDKCKVCYDLLQLHLDWEEQDVAAFLRVSPSMVSRYVKVHKYSIPVVLDAFKAGRIGIGAAYCIAKEHEDKQPAMLELSLNGTSRDDLERQRRKPKRRWNGASGKSKRVTCPLPSGRAVTVSASTTLTIDEVIDAAKELLREAEAARKLKDNLKMFLIRLVDRAKQTGHAEPTKATAMAGNA